MTTHELARLLLANDDAPVRVGWETSYQLSEYTSDTEDHVEPVRRIGVLSDGSVVISAESYFCVDKKLWGA